MRIVLIANGWIPIPPPAWGAIEILIWDMYVRLTKLGHNVLIVNTHNKDEIISLVNNFNPNIIHLHWEEYYVLLDRMKCKNVIITGHRSELPFVRDIGFHSGNYKIVALSPEIKQKYIEFGCNPSKLLVIPNAIDEELFNFNPACLYTNRSAYVGVIDERKKQYKYTSINSLYFIGKINCQKFKKTERYLGEWTKQTLYSFLTCFANLVLLSSAECHALVTCEALMCGLGVVVSEAAAGNLDRSKSWITVIPNDKLDDLQFVDEAIRENRKQSLIHRQEIRKYALETFSWNVRIPEVLKTYETILSEQS
jgi:glycosyltransferase involved in cell wall biosynthesis